MELGTYPFRMLRRQVVSLIIPLIPIVFLLAASLAFPATPNGEAGLFNIVDYQFGGGSVYLSASDITKYDQIGADGVPPIMRLGGITRQIDVSDFLNALGGGPEALSVGIIFLTIFLGYLSYAMVSRIVYGFKAGNESRFGLKGINLSTIALSFIAAFVVLFIASFSIAGFELVLLLNFGVIFMIAIPIAASGERFGECFFKAFDYMKFNLGKLVTIYLLCMGVVIAAPIGLLIIFMFPLSVLDASVVPAMQLFLSLFGITFALFYQFVVCSRAVYEYHRKPMIKQKPTSYAKIAKKVKQE